jgi:hypothetical protein
VVAESNALVATVIPGETIARNVDSLQKKKAYKKVGGLKKSLNVKKVAKSNLLFHILFRKFFLQRKHAN